LCSDVNETFYVLLQRVKFDYKGSSVKSLIYLTTKGMIRDAITFYFSYLLPGRPKRKTSLFFDDHEFGEGSIGDQNSSFLYLLCVVFSWGAVSCLNLYFVYIEFLIIFLETK